MSVPNEYVLSADVFKHIDEWFPSETTAELERLCRMSEGSFRHKRKQERIGFWTADNMLTPLGLSHLLGREIPVHTIESRWRKPKHGEYLTVTDVAKHQGISRWAVYKRIREKKLKAKQRGDGVYLIPADQFL